MSNPFPQNLNSILIQTRGREIIHKLREDVDSSEIMLVSEDARNQIVKRAKSYIDGDRSGLSGVEKGVLLQYVIDGITGNADPDSRLDLLLKTNFKAQPMQGSFTRPTGWAGFLSALLPSYLRTPTQKVVGMAVLLLLLGWTLSLWGQFVYQCMKSGGQINIGALSGVVVISFLPVTMLCFWVNAVLAGQKAKKQWLEHPETHEQQLKELADKVKNSAENLQRDRWRWQLIGVIIALFPIVIGIGVCLVKSHAR
jgi:hypothetical protein